MTIEELVRRIERDAERRYQMGYLESWKGLLDVVATVKRYAATAEEADE